MPIVDAEGDLKILERSEDLGFPPVTAGDWVALDDDDSVWLDLSKEEMNEMIHGMVDVAETFEALANEAEAEGIELSDDELFVRFVALQSPK